MKVYVVEKSWPYEGSDAIGVFSKEEQAAAYCEAQRKTGSGAIWSYNGFDVDALLFPPFGRTSPAGGAEK